MTDGDDACVPDLTTASIVKDAIVRACPRDADIVRPRMRSVMPPARAFRLPPIRRAVAFAWPPSLTDEAIL